MGCDIHASVEYRAREANELWPERWWRSIDVVSLPRDYAMFGAMVDGHGRAPDIGGVAPERGLPPHPSDIRKDMEWNEANPESVFQNRGGVFSSDHTLSWLTPEEFRAAIARRRDARPFPPLDMDYLALAAYLDALAMHGPVRLVFGFDS